MVVKNMSHGSPAGTRFALAPTRTLPAETCFGWVNTASASSPRRPYDVLWAIDPAHENSTLCEGTINPIGAADESTEHTEDVEVRRMRLEAILLLAKTPLSTRKLAQLAHLADGTEARTLVRHLNRCYDQAGRAMRIEQIAGGYRLLTRPAFSPWLARLGHLPPAVRLSSPMMETLAVIAYRQDVSRADIEAVRGVACGELLRQLMERDLVRIAGRSEELGRPYLYGTTKRFLQLFGLASIEALPPIRWQSFPRDPDARDVDEQTDSHPHDSRSNESTTSMKESVVSTAFASVLSTASAVSDIELDPQIVAGIALPNQSPVLVDDDEDDFGDDDDDDDVDDEDDDDLEDDDDFDDDWDDEDEEDEDDAEEEADEADDDWEEVDDADADEDDDEDDVEEEDADEEEDDDWDDEEEDSLDDDDDDEDDDEDEEWD